MSTANDSNSSAPGGFPTGKAALEALAASIRQIDVYGTLRARLQHANDDLARASSQVDWTRQRAEEAIRYFAEHDPASLGILWPDPALETHIEDIGLKFENVLGDAEAILRHGRQS